MPYELPLSVQDGGDAARSWQLTRGSEAGLSIDPSTGRLSGLMTETAPITVEVTVSEGTSEGRARYTIEPRESCWFAYASTETGEGDDSRRVHLVDPLLLDTAPRHDLPRDLPAGASVEDFRFAPGGRWLAVRVNDAGNRTVQLFTAPNWESAGVIDVAGSVLDYAWSPNAQVLAVASESGGERTLGGVRVPSDPTLGADGVTPLIPVVTPVESPLVWVGNGSIAFYAQDALDPLRYYAFSGLLADGDAEFTGVGAFPDYSFRNNGNQTLTLVPGSASFVTVQTTGQSLELISFAATAQGGPAFVASFIDDSVVSPQGDYLARSADGQLQIFRADESTLSNPVPIATATGCDRLLAWARDDSRLACAMAGDPRGSLRIFTFAGGQLTGALVEGEYDDLVNLDRRRRAFTPDGRWFTFSTNYYLYSVDLGSRPLQQRKEVAQVNSEAAPAEFALSPDGKHVLVHTGEWLEMRELSDLTHATTVTQERLGEALPCTEIAAWASESACGTTRTHTSQSTWSPDSRVFAFRTAASQLLVRQTGIDAPARSLSNACDSTCIGSSDFQPLNH